MNTSIESLLKDSRACWLLSNKHQFVQQEYTLSTHDNGKLVNIIIDRTFVDNNIRWIIDYKTTQHSDDKFEKYKTQLQLYQSVMEKFDPVHTIKIGVYFPLNSEWLEF
jgi:ATP-dependent exoDNAse (exonuclease V) beta subunit